MSNSNISILLIFTLRFRSDFVASIEQWRGRIRVLRWGNCDWGAAKDGWKASRVVALAKTEWDVKMWSYFWPRPKSSLNVITVNPKLPVSFAELNLRHLCSDECHHQFQSSIVVLSNKNQRYIHQLVSVAWIVFDLQEHIPANKVFTKD